MCLLKPGTRVPQGYTVQLILKNGHHPSGWCPFYLRWYIYISSLYLIFPVKKDIIIVYEAQTVVCAFRK